MITNRLYFTLITALSANSLTALVNNAMRGISMRFGIAIATVKVQTVCAQELTDNLFTRYVVHITVEYVDTTPDTSIIHTVLYNQLGSAKLGDLFIGHARFVDKE